MKISEDGWDQCDVADAKYQEILKPLNAEAPRILQSGDAAQLGGFHERLQHAIAELKQIRMQAEYDMQTHWETVLAEAVRGQTPTPVGKFTP